MTTNTEEYSKCLRCEEPCPVSELDEWGLGSECGCALRSHRDVGRLIDQMHRNANYINGVTP